MHVDVVPRCVRSTNQEGAKTAAETGKKGEGGEGRGRDGMEWKKIDAQHFDMEIQQHQLGVWRRRCFSRKCEAAT